MADILTPQMRNAIAAQCNAVFANPNAQSDEVLEAMISYLTINSVSFYTASGEIALHLQAGAQAIKAQRITEAQAKRRFLGMPKEEGDGS
jgi:hypothetical protein